jgi:nucleoside diphosphate kinase
MSAIYVINGFYMAMREKYTKPSASITYFCVEWDESKLTWADFRGKVLGATDPTVAVAGSLRRIILEQYKELGLSAQPNVGDNGVHASASPFEALAERMNWIGVNHEVDEFGKALLNAGVKTIKEWTKDPQVEYEGKKGSLFDTLEDTNVSVCLTKCQKIAKGSGPTNFTKNMAFVFVKPHAVTPKVVDLVKKKFAEAGISIVKEGSLDGKTIESKLLIDNHYYAIANKASLSKPKDLNVPPPKQDEFKQMFGLTWTEALEKGMVFNAVDACAHLGINGETMDTCWAKTKKANLLVKFGGGFYCGKVTKD